jgi:hypothetical protein
MAQVGEGVSGMNKRRNDKTSGNGGPAFDIDYRRDPLPSRVREIIETHLAIEAEDAKASGNLGFMTRALAIASMPHRNPFSDIYERRNGTFQLRMLAGSSAGLPYGKIPRVLVAWVTTEAVRTRSANLVLGESLAEGLQELGLCNSGGARGDIGRLRDQMRRLFGAFISAEFDNTATSPAAGNGRVVPIRSSRIRLSNIMLVEDADVWWMPNADSKEGQWQGTLRLSQKFFRECIEAPVPVDLRAYKALGSSPLAMDIYTWLTYRMSYLRKPSPLIRWEALMNQFGSRYAMDEQGIRNFKKAFLRELKRVSCIYPAARIRSVDGGIRLQPSPPHVRKQPLTQGQLF